MKKKHVWKRLMSFVLSAAMVAGGTLSTAFAESYDYPNKYLWYLPTESFTWDDYGSLYEHHRGMGIGGFDIDKLVDSQLGESMVENIEYFLKYQDEMHEDVVNHFAEMGIKKELHDADNPDNKWAVYTPHSADEPQNADKTYPVVFVFHGNNNPIFLAESYGYAQMVAEEEFICVMPWATNGTNLDAEMDRIWEILERDYPIDESRIYATGFSLGGRSTVLQTARTPNRFAAIGVGGQHLAGSNSAANPIPDEQWAQLKDIPLIQMAGTYDRNKHFPVGQKGDLQIDALNKWYHINGIDKQVTIEECQNLVETTDNIVEKKLGLTCDDTYIQYFDGTEYYTGDYFNDAGVNMMKVIAIEGLPHWVSGSFAKVVWDYMSQFARDPETGEMIVLDNDEPEKYTEGVTVTKDENSPTGYYANFVYRDREASNVQLLSDVMYFYTEEGGRDARYTPYEWTKGMFPMNGGKQYAQDMTYRGDGYWTLQLPLPSGAFTYKYAADGVQLTDPANPPMMNTETGLNANFSVVYMPFDADKQVIDRSIELPRTDEQKGTVQTVTYMDGGTARPLSIYLPYGFDKDREEPYKVLYLSHGGKGHELDWMNDGAVPNMMDNLIAEGRTEPAIVVTMNNELLGWDYPEIERNMFDCVIPFMEENYNASKAVADRSFAGLSKGATLTTTFYLNHPDAFGYFGIWSSGDLNTFDVTQYENLNEPTVMIGVGNQDTDRDRLLKAQQFCEQLDGVGVDYTYYTENGAHDWMLWPRLYAYYMEHVLWQTDEHKIAVEADDDVTVALDKTKAQTGETVSFTVQADNLAKEVDRVTLYNADKSSARVLTAENGVYTFQMPDEDVLIAVSLKDVKAPDTDHLAYILSIADNYIANGDLDGVATSVKASFDKAYAAAEDVLERARQTPAQATQTEIDEAAAALLSTFKYLELKADKSMLSTLISLAESMLKDQASYIPSSIAGLQAVVDEAKAVEANPDVLNKEISQMVVKLIDEIDKARLKPDKSALEELVARMNALDGKLYTKASFNALMSAVKAGEKVLADENADAETVNGSVAEIEEQYAKLEKAGGTSEEPAVSKPGDSTSGSSGGSSTARKPVPHTGDDGLSMAVCMALILASGLMIVVMKKRGMSR